MEQIYDQLFSSINSIALRTVESTPIDKTIDAEIRAIVNIDIGEYKVSYQDDLFSVFVLDPTVTYKIGELVYILVPQGNFSMKKILLGRAKAQNNISYREQNALRNFYKTRGPNWLEAWYIPNSNFLTPEICAVPESDNTSLVHPDANWKDYHYLRYASTSAYNDDIYKNLTNYPPADTNDLAALEKSYLRYAAAYDFIQVSADFTTFFSEVHEEGEYFLEVRCIAKNPHFVPADDPHYDAAQKEFNLLTFNLGFKDFIGAPYVYAATQPNSAVFSVPKGTLKGLYSVALCQNGQFKSDLITAPGTTLKTPNYTDNNIKVENISIRFAEKVSLANTLYWTRIDLPYGDTISEAAGKIPNRLVAEAHLFYGYQSEITSMNTCTFKWYRRAAEVMQGDKQSRFDPDAGPGWMLIADSSKPDRALDGYKTIENRLEVRNISGKPPTIPWMWKYKCVIIYGTKDTESLSQQKTVIIDEEFELYNKDTQYNLSLVQFQRPSSHAQYLKIQNYELPEVWYGDWYRLLNDNSYVYLPATNTNSNNPRQYGEYDITSLLQYDAVTVLVNCFDPKLTSDSPAVAVLEKTLIGSDLHDFYVKWVGPQSFSYDAEGSIKFHQSQQDNQLYAQFQWLEGTGTDCLVSYLAPDGAYLKNQEQYTQDVTTGGAQGYNIEDSMLKDMWIDNENVIHFKVKEKYDRNKENNTFRLQVFTVSDGEYREVGCEIKFSKDGQQGTIGADWQAQLWPTNSTQNYDNDPIVPYTHPLQYPSPMVLQSNSGSWPFTQLRTGSNAKYKVFIRPFIHKNGQRIEELPQTEGYTYRVFWDVRYPQNSLMPNTANGSFLKLCDVTGATLTSTGGFQLGTTNPPNTAGYQAYTEWRGPNTDVKDNTVELRWTNDSSIGDFSNVRYNFYVKAQIDIFQGAWDPENDTHSDVKMVASINTIYPIDLFITDSPSPTLNPKLIYTNWPQFVDYNATGYNPETYADPLYFKYGKEANSPLYETKSFPVNNLTHDLQTIELMSEKQYYRPRTHFYFQDGYNGALSTVLSNSPFKSTEQYIRNQIFRLNNYGNADINAWDGQGVDIKEERGTIFAATVGAGYKAPHTNAFTGVLMGIDSSQLKSGRRIDEKGGAGYRQGLDSDYEQKTKYMTGLYGYQEGYASFGIMENGTAFFGRADRGGRIIIDGYNATIYGGANGMLEDPAIGDPMWNTMRLTFVDLTHSTGNIDPTSTASYYSERSTNIATTEVDGVKQGFNGAFFGMEDESYTTEVNRKNIMPWWYSWIWKNAWMPYNNYSLPPNLDPSSWYHVNYWDRTLALSVNGVRNQPLDDNTTYHPEDLYILRDGLVVSSSGRGGLTGFGPNRASTTPAIEIGQHPHGLMPGLIEYEDSYKVLSDIEIPGDRNFMVTYDGTLWAMNGMFRGNLISSNIVGGRIMGAEIGIGDDISPYATFTYTYISERDRFPKLIAPTETKVSDQRLMTDTGEVVPKAFYVNEQGQVWAREINIYGGKIDIGHFHLASDGYLTNFGENDFVGPTHFYGSVGIGPLYGGGSVAAGINPATNQHGNLYQSRGTTVLGMIAIPDGTVDFHNIIPHDLRIPISWDNQEKYAVFSINSIALKNKTELDHFVIAKTANGSNTTESPRAHVWPMYFTTNVLPSAGHQVEAGWGADPKKRVWFMTTMDYFKNKKLTIGTEPWNGPLAPPASQHFYQNAQAGGNYFRVGTHGVEFVAMSMRNHWVSEYDQEDLSRDTILGFFAPAAVQDGGKPEITNGKNFGIYSIGQASMILSSEKHIRLSSVGNQYFYAGNHTGGYCGDPGEANIDKQHSVLYLGSENYGNANLAPGATSGDRDKAQIAMMCAKALFLTSGRGDANEIGPINRAVGPDALYTTDVIQAGLWLGSKHTSVRHTFLWNWDAEMHIVCGPDEDGGTGSKGAEIMMRTDEGDARMVAKNAVGILRDIDAHVGMDTGKSGFVVDMNGAFTAHDQQIMGVIGGTTSFQGGKPPDKPGYYWNSQTMILSNGQGNMKGEGSKIGFYDAWEDPENQEHIYARFG